MRNIFDTHAHYTDERFSSCPEGADGIIRQMMSDSVCGIVNVAVNTRNAQDVIAQAKLYDGMYAAVGVYPEDASSEEGGVTESVARLEAFIRNKEENKIVAIGEIGLDYHYEGYDKALQLLYFEEQMKLAERTGLPVIIHDREAHGDCFDMCCKYPKVKGLFHSYSGSAEMAKDLCRRGWYISFSGVITFKNAVKVREACAAVPLDRLLLETDAPYLAPVPHRGECNRSDYIALSAETIAGIHGIDAETVRNITRDNAHKFFSL